ncbi:MAG: hypothetical protein IPP32_16505 [Bacteroidetes bacterium]|nr:hypothetical protein [Bacteroidota bacterium]
MSNNQYQCVVSSAGPCSSNKSTSSAAILTVSASCSSPIINLNPTSVQVTAPGGTSFTVTANGGVLPYSYQWQYDTGSGWINVPNSAPYSGVNSNILNISATALAMTNNQYQCIVSSASPCSSSKSISSIAILTVSASCSAPIINLNPTSVQVTAPGGTSFTVTANGGVLPYSYQWQYDTGSGWINVPNSSPYSGVNSNILNISSTSLAMSNNQYQCVVSSASPCSSNKSTSSAAILTVSASCSSPIINLNPTSVQVTVPGGASFTVTANGGVLPYSYQWQYNTGSGWINVPNSAPYSGVNSNILNISATTLAMSNNQYQCIVSSASPCSSNKSTSSATILTVSASCSSPIINLNPTSVQVTAPGGTSFTVTANGGVLPYSYQWQYDTGSGWINVPNSAPFSGINSSMLNINNTTLSMSGYQFKCIISSSSPCNAYNAISNAASLNVNSPINDIVMSNSGTYTVCSANFYDGGGIINDYPDNQYSVVTIYPSTIGAKVSVTFNSFNTETHYHDLSNYSQIDDDILYVYNGNSTSSVQVGALQGQAGYGTITSSAADGSLTFKFVSHSPYYTATSGTRSGWSATLACNYTPTDISMIASGSFTTCGGNFYDSGGPLGDYMDNQSTIMPSGGTIVTIYPSTVGAKVSVTFNSFNTETHYHDLSNYSQIDDDILYVYNGNSTSSVQVGALQGQAGYGTITSSAADGSLTFKFVSHSHIILQPVEQDQDGPQR